MTIEKLMKKKKKTFVVNVAQCEYLISFWRVAKFYKTEEKIANKWAQ